MSLRSAWGIFQSWPKTDLSPSSCPGMPGSAWGSNHVQDCRGLVGASRERSREDPPSASPSRKDDPARAMDLEPKADPGIPGQELGLRSFFGQLWKIPQAERRDIKRHSKALKKVWNISSRWFCFFLDYLQNSGRERSLTLRRFLGWTVSPKNMGQVLK